MRKVLMVPAVLLLLFTAASAESRFFLSAGAGYLRPADENYRLVYGNQALYPEIAAAVRLVGGLCLTGSYGTFKKTGTTPELEFETTATQTYFTAGLSYIIRASRILCFELGGALTGMSFREDALGAWVKGRQPGYKVEVALLLVPEDERVFFGVRAGTITARIPDISSEITGPQPILLGGIRIAVVVGIQLFGDD
jgi:hypothetical protein